MSRSASALVWGKNEVSLLTLRTSMLDQCEVVFARADMIQHLMPQWQRGKRKNKWRVLLFQRLDLAFFPSCETSESQV